MNEKYLKPYNHQNFEDDIYNLWEKSGYFNPDKLPLIDGKIREQNWCCIMPPPNANGSLHAGHALFITLEDIMTRFQRMNGKRVLWLPGADHAGFETQVVYEKKLIKEGRSRFQMTNEELYKEIFLFTKENKSFMENQIRQLGASCDWSRKLFTLDEKIIKTVYNTFEQLEKDKLLYRGLRSINWCPKHQTGLSNLEVDYEEREDLFYYFQYGPFVIGTSRPETKFGDKYVVMHPDDKRYKEYKHRQKIKVEWINGIIEATVIKDKAGDMEKGTGVMTITPWHSSIDWEIAQRHNLDYEQIINEKGKILSIGGEFIGLNIKEARKKIVEKLKEKGLLVKIDEKYKHSVSVCYKCKREIEPQLKKQWFIKMKNLAEKAIKSIENKEVEFITEQHKKIALHWLNNIEDWNISRQIIWGIPIPAKICENCDAGFVDLKNEIINCKNCDTKLKKDTDTFDTWFSSGQWPFASLGYPDNKDYKDFYPTDVMETGHDILFFWVVRMIMLGIYRTGKVPFKNIYLHGLVKDKKGVKMSKSKGNVISPLEISNQYGTDSLRMSLIIGNSPGNNLNLDSQKVNSYKKFSNKLWNIARFIYSNTENFDYENFNVNFLKKYQLNKITELDEIKKNITEDIEKYRFHLASEKIYHYIWHQLADKIIEDVKKTIINKEKDKNNQYLILKIFEELLKMLHPFMPFITEEIWKNFPKKNKNLLIVEKW